MAKVIVGSGFVAQYPEGGGVFSVVVQYLLGLRRLGCQICWLELLWPEGEADRDHIRTFAKRLADFGLEDDFCLIYFPRARWPEAWPEREWHGFSQDQFRSFCREADILLDLCYSIRPPDLLANVRRAAFLDLDPVFMQLAMHQKAIQLPHDVFFTVGQNIGRATCSVPSAGVEWRSFWPPVDLDLWYKRDGNAETSFSTVSQWWGYPPVDHNGETYDGSKRTEFLSFVDLPNLTGEKFELALNLSPVADTEDRQLLTEKGWRLVEAHQAAGDFPSYRHYVQSARAEFSVAKPAYAKSRSGWFSDRSASYLAAGKPVLVQDTGFGDHLPVGRGVLSFTTVEQAMEGVEEIRRNYSLHSEAAREIAREHFAAEKVLDKLLRDAGL
ncbi:MAG TPA: hypothetical protein VHM64_19075 [Candidatus Binatia bacterium]|nr:hypothetical protein [Candidatus Binatia bacterium]